MNSTMQHMGFKEVVTYGIGNDMRSVETANFRPAGKHVLYHYDRNDNLIGIYHLENGIVDVGLNHILNTEFDGGTPATTWYIGLIDNASYSALSNSDVMSSHTGWIENSNYSGGARPQWTCGSASSRSITNSSTVNFAITATVTIKGIFIAADNTLGGTTGTLWSTAAFGSTVTLNNGDTLKVTYTISG